MAAAIFSCATMITVSIERLRNRTCTCMGTCTYSLNGYKVKISFCFSIGIVLTMQNDTYPKNFDGILFH